MKTKTLNQIQKLKDELENNSNWGSTSHDPLSQSELNLIYTKLNLIEQLLKVKSSKDTLIRSFVNQVSQAASASELYTLSKEMAATIPRKCFLFRQSNFLTYLNTSIEGLKEDSTNEKLMLAKREKLDLYQTPDKAFRKTKSAHRSDKVSPYIKL